MLSLEMPNNAIEVVWCRVVCACGEYEACVPAESKLPHHCHFCHGDGWKCVTTAHGITTRQVPSFSLFRVELGNGYSVYAGHKPKKQPKRYRGARPRKAREM